jgi:DNA-binding NtrC family response regulator
MPAGARSLLKIALDATGAERAYIVRATKDGRSAVREFCCRREDGRERPSRTVMLQALARGRPFICADLGDSHTLAAGPSVRSLRLRTVCSAPLRPVGGDAALIMDSRLAPALPKTHMQEIVECFAALLGLTVDGGVAAKRYDRPRDDLAGRSRPFREMLSWARSVAGCDLPVLIFGESGSGKEGVARLVHTNSPRSGGPFVAVNCTALTETLLDAELFGTTRGAYTGSHRDRPGLFRMARGGTLFLDEVGDTSPAMQAKLLRAIEEKCVRPVGGEQELPIDARILAATHHDLRRRIRDGTFRADLFHRLAVLEVEVPPLRKRRDDLPLLVEKLAPRLQRETGRGPLRLAPCAWDLMLAYPWPGNVRELHAVLARALLRADGGEIEASHLELRFPIFEETEPSMSSSEPLEKMMISAALRESGGNVAKAALRIGWSRQKLYRRMKTLSVG